MMRPSLPHLPEPGEMSCIMKSNILLTCLGYTYLKIRIFFLRFSECFSYCICHLGLASPKAAVTSEKSAITASVDCGELI